MSTCGASSPAPSGPLDFTSSRNAVEALFESLYRRSGARYLDVVVALMTGFVIIFAVPAYSVLLVPYFRIDGAELVRVVAAFELAMIVGTVGVFVIARRTFAPMVRWLRGERGTEPAERAWSSAVATLPRTVVAVGVWYVVLCTPPALYVSRTTHLAWFATLLYLIVLLLLVVGLVVFGYLYCEEAFRPVIRDLVPWLPPDFRPGVRTASLGGKMLVILPAINLYTGMIVAIVSTTSLGLDARLAVTTGAAILITATLSLGLTLMFRHSLVVRLDDIRRAIRRVEAGDLSVRLANVAGDELDEVGRSFNAMVTGLEERGALRAENASLVDELRASRARIVAAADEARRQIERDLHDGAQQRLVVLDLKLALVERTLARDPVAGVVSVPELRVDVERAIGELRDLAHGIYPALLESEGLRGALQEAVERAALPVELRCEETARFPPEIEAAVYFCCREALQNAAKHAGGEAVAVVEVAVRDGALTFSVSDGGRGFDTSTSPGGVGLQNMADRVGALGGVLSVHSSVGAGTTVAGAIPIAQARSQASTASTRR